METRNSEGLARRLGLLAITAAPAGLLLASLLGRFGGAVSWFDLLAHFRLIYVLLGAGLLGAAVALRRPAAVSFALAGLAFNLWLLRAPLAPPVEPNAPGELLRVVVCNIDYEHPDAARTARAVADLEPDLIVLSEVSDARLAPFLAEFPAFHSIAVPREGVFGIAILSRYPLLGGTAPHSPPWSPILEGQLKLAGHEVRIAALHTSIPMNSSMTRSRDQMLDDSARALEAAGKPALMLGDFNATPWSRELQRIFRRGALRELPGMRLIGTYPSTLGRFGLPIDHILTTSEWRIRAVRRLPSAGADHRLLFAELALN